MIKSRLTRLQLTNFKNFRSATLPLGPFTLLVGTNASGKSNVRDAFRFLHGISRAYSLAEIIGEKWIEGGVLQWKGIRGGTREAAFHGESRFAIEVSFETEAERTVQGGEYLIEIELGRNGGPPRVVRERLTASGKGTIVFDSHPGNNPPTQADPLHLAARLSEELQKDLLGPSIKFLSSRPVLSQVGDHPDVKLQAVRELCKAALGAFGSMRFLDLAPEAMRLASIPGQTVLGDRGENLSSVVQAICEDSRKRETLAGWLRALTPMDAADFEFQTDPSGKVLLTLVETSGKKVSAHSASDGTLRFLAMISALLGPEPARFYFFEELENGLHPNRLHLLLELIEREVGVAGIQMVATTHSPQLLGLLNAESREHASVVYRLEHREDAGIRRILDIPGARKVLEERDWARLHESGWMENALEFAEPDGLGALA